MNEREGQQPENGQSGDEAIIGRAFRWSLMVIGFIAAAVVVVLLVTREGPEQERVVDKELGAIPDLVHDAPRMPQVRFTDVTAESGIDFVHVNGARGDKLLPETMGSGAAFLDYDGDGDPDLLLVNGAYWPGDERGHARPTPALYSNDGTGSFTEVTREAGLDVVLYGTGVAVGDHDNDGDPDLFLAALGPDRLFRNDGGTFREVTDAAGVAGGPEDWSTSAGFFDHDNDGDLDLFVCRYVRWSREIDIELDFTLNGVDRAYGPPTSYEGTYNALFRNEGGGRFVDVSEQAGLRVDNPLTGRPLGKSLGLTFLDADRDGHLDVFVANDTVGNFLFHNRGDGTFREIGSESGIAFDGTGRATGAMGIDAAHYRNDEGFGVGISNFANEMTSLYVSRRGDLQFTDESAGEGIGSPSRRYLSFGLLFFDFDLDGRLDLLQANGHLEDEINQVQSSQHYRQPAQLFWNAGPDERSCFIEVPAERTGDLGRPVIGRGASFADIDADGDLDVLLTQAGGRPVLLRNDLSAERRALRVTLTGTASNRDAIGAWVELVAGGVLQRRQVMPTRSYLCQVELPVTLGLGAADRAESLSVIWPDGSRSELDPPAAGLRLHVRQGELPGR